MSKEIQKQEERKGVRAMLESPMIKGRIQEILGKNASTFAASVVQIANSNALLAKAEPSSIIGAAMTAATLKLPLNNQIGQAYIVPFNTKNPDGTKTTKAQFILGYKGLKQLAIRSGQYRHIYAKEVYEGQKVDDDSFLGYHFDWKAKESNKVIGYASYYELLNGFESVLFMSNEELQDHGKKYSQTFKNGYGLWKDDYHKMALKTVTKLHLNSGEAPLSIDMQNALEGDQAVMNFQEEDGTIDVSYPDNEVTPEHDHDKERMLALINGIENEDDIEFARPNITEEYLPLFKEKVKEVNKKIKAEKEAEKSEKKESKK